MEQSSNKTVNDIWYSRPVFFASSIQPAISFYTNKLGFNKSWHENEGKGTVCQVNRSDCEIILCEDASAGRTGRIFLELSRRGVEQLLDEIEFKKVPVKKIWWGYNVLQIKDPDNNELLVCLDNLL